MQKRILSLILCALIFVPSTAFALRSTAACHLTNTPTDRGTLLAEFTTHFKASNVRRAANVRLAASRLDGLVIPAKKQLSYNAVVGPRTAATGFHPALVIDQGKYVERSGGGVCQPSSTLYAAALFSGLKAVDRSNHSWQSPYIGPGLDAAVVWSTKDLVLRNPHPFDVRIRTIVAPDHITVQVLGKGTPGVHYGVQATVERTFAYGTVETEAPRLSVGKRLLTARGIDGLRVKRKRVTWMRDRVRRVERLSLDTYFPRQERYLVGTYVVTVSQALLPESEPGLEPQQSKQSQ